MSDEPEFPDTPAGEQARWHLRQIRTNAAGLTEAEVAEHMALAPPWEPSRALAHFADCLEHDRPFETDGDHNLETMRTIFAGIESARTGRPVAIAELR